MTKIRIILNSNSTKDLFSATASIVDICKNTGCFISGPVSFKNKKLIDLLNANNRTVNKLIVIKLPKSIQVQIET